MDQKMQEAAAAWTLSPPRECSLSFFLELLRRVVRCAARCSNCPVPNLIQASRRSSLAVILLASWQSTATVVRARRLGHSVGSTCLIIGSSRPSRS
ncbi:hypothetical protein BCV70DRAFT_52368 [Testicularia cyperi]|uniref:Uncharacterized protein n=1 Tax=Testicularia cyperi TaxID=1882483 RepID=A0A317XU78_9BASI|nr:hypothetical protein BCV70DRAFT_52368 [Testicularia cyperi]